MLKYILIALGCLVVLTLAFLGVRGTASRQPPMMFFDDMDDQPKYKNQAGSAFFPDGRQMRLPPQGSVAWGRESGRPDPALLVDDGVEYQRQRIAGKIDYELLDRGRRLYGTYCTVCHGGFGNGNGVATQYGMAPPANYHTDRLRQATDGYLYQVITEGKGLMGPYGPSIRPADRWAIVAYVRALQTAGMATIDDVPAAQREELTRSDGATK